MVPCAGRAMRRWAGRRAAENIFAVAERCTVSPTNVAMTIPLYPKRLSSQMCRAGADSSRSNALFDIVKIALGAGLWRRSGCAAAGKIHRKDAKAQRRFSAEAAEDALALRAIYPERASPRDHRVESSLRLCGSHFLRRRLRRAGTHTDGFHPGPPCSLPWLHASKCAKALRHRAWTNATRRRDFCAPCYFP